MSKSKALFDPGKILEVAENGLTYLFVKFENYVEGTLGGNVKSTVPKRRNDQQERKRQKANRELAESQEIAMEIYIKDPLQTSAQIEQQVAEHTQQLGERSQEKSQESDLDRD